MKTLIPLAAALLIAAAPSPSSAAMPTLSGSALEAAQRDLMHEIKHNKHWRGHKHAHKRRGGPPSHSRYKGPPWHSYYSGPPPHARAMKKRHNHRHYHSPRQHYRLPAPGGLHLHFSFPD
ncbi:MAG TPA: hypothetical protein VKY54_01985 [Kiloniellales bacterium]|nr:hypothetical protein [Kiloniellales bacterium]